MSHRGARLLLALFAALLSCACGTPPQKEMDLARAAIEAARAAGAERYAADGLAAARTALARSEAAARQRDYRLALAQSLEAAEQAQDAARTAAAAQTAIRAKADSFLAQLEATADRAKQVVATAEAARPSRTTRLAISDLRRAIVVSNVALQKAREALGQQDYPAAVTACEGALVPLDAAIRAVTGSSTPRRRG